MGLQDTGSIGNRAYLAAVCRDSTGWLIEACRGEFSTNSVPLIAKTQAIILAFQAAEGFSLFRVVFEGDSLLVCRTVMDVNFPSLGPL